MVETVTAPRQTRIRPMLYAGPMVRAIREGRKFQTRRLVNPQPIYDETLGTWQWQMVVRSTDVEFLKLVMQGHCPYGRPGDKLWVRETCYLRPERTRRMMREGADTWPPVFYRADMSDGDVEWCKEHGWKPTPSIHMPRWACRLILEITEVRAQRLQDISTSDCIHEGIEEPRCSLAADCFSENWPGVGAIPDELSNAAGGRPWRECSCAVESFKDLWDSINRKRCPWKSNPWVWAISFKRVDQ